MSLLPSVVPFVRMIVMIAPSCSVQHDGDDRGDVPRAWPIRRRWAESKHSQWQTLHVTCRLWSGMYRLEALASRLIIGMASWLIVKLVVGELVGL